MIDDDDMGGQADSPAADWSPGSFDGARRAWARDFAARQAEALWATT